MHIPQGTGQMNMVRSMLAVYARTDLHKRRFDLYIAYIAALYVTRAYASENDNKRTVVLLVESSMRENLTKP